MSMNTPIGNITQTTPIKNFKELDEMQNEQYLLGIDNNTVGNGSKISLENLINSSISTDSDNLITKGTDNRLLVNTPVEIGDLSNLTTTNKSTLVAAINEVDSDIATEVTNRVNAVSGEATTRQNADNNLQSQIDAITAASDVTDIVGTYAELQAYDTTGLADKSVIKVLQDESRENETTYYRWVITGGVGAWVLIGEEGPYYTISQADSKFATQATVGNLSNLATSDKSSIVNAMNELASVLDPTQTADYIKNSKAIYSGEVSENALILPQIKEMAHSTFDLSKFTVVGSPIITDDGIASGFSSSNYLNKQLNITPSNTLKFICKFTTGADISTFQCVCALRSTNYAVIISGGNIQIRYKDTNTYKVISASTNTTYYVILEWISSTSVKIKHSTDGINWVDDGTGTSSITQLYTTYIGVTHEQSAPFTGSIDLKQLSITVDGVPVFSGNKTGIDTIKSDDYTVVGTPTISADGIASGFSSSNRIEAVFSTEEDKTVTIKAKIKYLLNNVAQQTPFMLDGICRKGITYPSIRPVITNSSINIWGLTSNLNISCSLHDNDIIEIELILSTTSATLNAKINGNLQTPSTNTQEYEIFNLQKILLGYTDVSNGIWQGSIDLNAFKIYVDGNLVYQPCLKIPYTESKTGSKIAQSVYRERVSDMYEQFGYAPYYTLSDTDFTLPQGEIYGYLEKRARDIAHPVAQPFYRFSDEINEDEVRLEGAEVDKGLYLAIEQDPYLSALCTAGSTTDKICLPDFRNRVIYGDVASGYIEPELPNITGSISFNGIDGITYSGTASGAFTKRNYTSAGNGHEGNQGNSGVTFNFNANNSSSIYKNNGTVKTAGVKARWLCRWK